MPVSKISKILTWIAASAFAILSIVSAIAALLWHCAVKPEYVSAGPPETVMLYSGNPVMEKMCLASCILFGILSLGLVLVMRKRNKT